MERFDSRYEDAFHWIKTKILAGSKKGLLNLIFWHLPLIFIEGKVVAAFFYPDDKGQNKKPLLDTIQITGSEIFKYQSFIDSFQKAVGDKTYGHWEHERNEKINKSATYYIERKTAEPEAPFDFLDYFGIPCRTDSGTAKAYYCCMFFQFPCFDGSMEIWVAVNKKEEESLWPYHENELEKFLKKIESTVKNTDGPVKEEGIVFTEDILAGHVLKHDIMPSVFKRKEKASDHGGLEIKLSDYMISAFSVLHESLLNSLHWRQNPCRLFILYNSRLFNPRLCVFLTEAQKQDYKKKYGEYRNAADKENEELKQFEEGIKHRLRSLREKEGNDALQLHMEAACIIMEKTEQSGTVSSLFKKRGFYELFLEKTTFNAHPVLFKKGVIKNDWQLHDQYSYPEELEKTEPLVLQILPNVMEDNVRSNGQARDAAYQFAMIPYFFRGHPFGCIAFFNPDLRDKKEWYGYLNKVLNILDEKEGTIYQAAIMDLCKNIFEVVEEFEDE